MLLRSLPRLLRYRRPAADDHALPTFEDPIRDANLLLAHAARRGLDVQKVAEPIVAAASEPASSPERKAQFWVAFAAVADMVQPVTIESLRAALPEPREEGRGVGPSKAVVAVRRYRRYAYRTLAILVLVQIYTLVGSNTLKDFDTFPNSDVEDLGRRLTEAQIPFSASPGAPASSPRDRYELSRMQLTLERAANRLQTIDVLLDGWRLGWHPILFTQAVWPTVRKAAAEIPVPDAATPTALAQRQSMAAQQYIRDRNVFEARVALSALQAYVLPFLYGMLGACVYILRTLAADVRKLEFSSEIGYRLRMPLGALAGVAVAWLPSSEPLTGATPLALAFLAGYSVEILFNAMDRLIDSLSGGGPTPPPAVPKPAAPKPAAA